MARLSSIPTQTKGIHTLRLAPTPIGGCMRLRRKSTAARTHPISKHPRMQKTYCSSATQGSRAGELRNQACMPPTCSNPNIAASVSMNRSTVRTLRGGADAVLLCIFISRHALLPAVCEARRAAPAVALAAGRLKASADRLLLNVAGRCGALQGRL